jgi:hypothetical protein
MVLRESHLENPATLASSKSGRLPKLALFGHAEMSDLSPLLDEQRTTFARGELFRFGPGADFEARDLLDLGQGRRGLIS